jgi:Glyoxalase-like domain
MPGWTVKLLGRRMHAMILSSTSARVCTSLLLFALAPRADAQMQSFAATAGVGIDHVILGVDDLIRGMEEFARRTGVIPVKGGVHPGRGTQNALASLGNGIYVEILAPSNEPGTPREADTMHSTLTPVGWALHTTDLVAVVAGMRAEGVAMSDIRPGARARPDGVQLSWQTAAATGDAMDAAPFFIQWGAGTPHPSTQSPTGCQFRSASLSEKRPAPLSKFLTMAGISVRVSAGETRAMTIVLACPKGEVVFRQATP